MNRSFSLSSVLLVLSAWIACAPAMAERTNLNDGWRFKRGEQANAAAVDLDDSGWRAVSVPHDASIEDRADGQASFDKAAAGGPSEAYLTAGTGWYRRGFDLPADVAGKTVLLRFEAVYMDAEVWINGQKLALHSYGYTAFDVDATRLARPGRNVVAVRINPVQPSSRWYAGSGIIRPVALEVLDATHIDPDGPTITTPAVSPGGATVRAVTQVFATRPGTAAATLRSIVLDADGREVRRSDAPLAFAADGTATATQTIAISRPRLWSPETPALYTLVQEVRSGGTAVDTRRTRFGVRSISFDAKRGFLLNGRRTLLKGGSIHHDNYMLGGAGVPRADRRKVELLKSAGFNAIRSAHNPASQATLDAADELGMLVIDEAFDTWSQSKRKYDYARFFKDEHVGDLTSMIAKSRNHPSIILWSTGNEIRTMLEETGVQESRALAALVHRLDPSRPATAAGHMFFRRGTRDWQPFMDTLDVAGYNYYPDLYLSDHRKFPNRVMYGSESFSRLAFANWDKVETMPWVIGDFVWTAFDYLGEAGIGWNPRGPYPWHLGMAGEIDATGRLRPAAYYRRVLWKTGLTPTSAFVEWPTADGSLPDGATRGNQTLNWVQPDLVAQWAGWPLILGVVKVVAFSEDEEVELFVNGETRGRRPVSRATEYKADFWVTYEPGELKVVGYVKGRPHSQWTLRTPGKPAAIRLSVDRPALAADGDDLAYITAELVDASGEPVVLPPAQTALSFRLTGPGTLAGVGNGDPVSLEGFQGGTRTTYRGRAVAVVRAGKAPGDMRIEVSGQGLAPVSAAIVSR